MGKDEFVIHIDRVQFKVSNASLTGAQIRLLPNPPIGPDRDLYLEQTGHDPDVLVGDDAVVEMKNGLHMFTAPREITPG